jgi:DnaJ like chaperone protein
MPGSAVGALLRLKQSAFWQSVEHLFKDRGFMVWHGKVVGAVVGMVAGGPAGAAVGAFLGHLFDTQSGSGSVIRSRRANPQQVQEAFFRTTFQVMGHVAKADGRVSEQDIQAARAIMREFQLGEPEVQTAIALFTQGKANAFPLQQALARFASMSAGRDDLRRMFMQIQLQVVLLSGGQDQYTRALLSRICEALDISGFELAQMEALLRAQQRGSSQNNTAGMDKLSEAYKVLGVEQAVSDQDVTKAYRRLMSQNHPDKLVAKGLPESMMRLAAEKTSRIRAAYDAVCEARGMK